MSASTSRLVVVGIVASALAGCGGSERDAVSEEQAIQDFPELGSEIAQLRRLVASFHQFEKASDAGWSEQFTPCLESPEGGMGFHYSNPALIDGAVDLLQPELLLYEPEAGGRLRFVGVEYIVPYTFVPRDAEPPVLLGQEFHQVDAAGLWGLHIWVARNNPSGLFADWNPNVSCAFAE
jgi:hypothetical protein